MNCFIVCAIFAALNLVKDPDVNRVPLSDEFRVSDCTRQARLSAYEEPYTWNRCAKFELVEKETDEKGEPRVNVGLEIGGTAKRPGFPVRGEAKYRFSFDLKGDAPTVLICQIAWDAQGKVLERKMTKAGSAHPVTNEWTNIRGVLETPKGAARAALVLKLWGHGAYYYQAVCTPGYHFLVDHVSIEEMSFGREIWPARALVVPLDGKAVARDFLSLTLGEGPAHYATEMRVRATDKGLDFGFALDNPSEKGETVEILLQRKDAAAAPLHLFLPVKDGRLVTTVPWKDFGYDVRPPAGTALRFNAMRERTLGEGNTFDPAVATRIGYGIVYDNSVFSFCGNEFNNKERLGVLLLGEDPKYGDDATAWWYASERNKEDARLEKIQRQPLVIAQVPVTTDPAIPYLPPELFEPKSELKLRAAVNEYAALPVAVANMTDTFEEYRVTVTSGFHHPTPAYEHSMPRHGFISADGTRIGSDRITLRRGVRFRDADTPNHGRRYDMLAKMGDVSSLPVAPKESGLVWIQIDCHGLEPGVYTGNLVVTPLSSGRKLKRDKITVEPVWGKTLSVSDDSRIVPIRFEVLPIELEEPTALALNGYRTAWSPYQVDFMKQYDYAFYFVTPWFFNAKYNPDGTIRTANLAPSQLPHIRMLNENVRRIGANPRVMIGYSCFTTFVRNEIKAGNPSIEIDSEAFWTAWREWLKFVERTMNENGFANDDYIMEVFDEPNQKEFPIERLTRVYREAKEAVPTMRLLSTNGEKWCFEAIEPYVDGWIFSPNVFGDSACRARAEKMRAKGGLTSFYACSTSMREDPYRYYRMLPWKAAAFGGDAVSLYQFYEQQPGSDFRGKPAGGVAYDTGEEIVPSIRLECLRAGMTDVRYLRLLQKIATAKKGEELADEAAAFARTALWEVPGRYALDATKADVTRDRCVKYLLQLKGAGTRP